MTDRPGSATPSFYGDTASCDAWGATLRATGCGNMVWEEADGTFGAEAHMAEEARVPDQPKPGLVCCEEAKRHVS